MVFNSAPFTCLKIVESIGKYPKSPAHFSRVIILLCLQNFFFVWNLEVQWIIFIWKWQFSFKDVNILFYKSCNRSVRLYMRVGDDQKSLFHAIHFFRISFCILFYHCLIQWNLPYIKWFSSRGKFFKHILKCRKYCHSSKIYLHIFLKLKLKYCHLLVTGNTKEMSDPSAHQKSQIIDI